MSDRPWGPQTVWILAVLVASIGFGLVPAFARWLTAAGVPPELVSFYRYPIMGLVLLPTLSFRPAKLRATGMGLLAGVAMGLGWIGYVLTLERTSVATAGVLYLCYPLFTMVFAWLLLAQRPGARALIAAAMVLASGYVLLTPGAANTLDLETVVLGLTAPLSFGFGIVVLTGWLGNLNPLQRVGSVSLGACIGLAPLVGQHPISAIIPAADLWGLVLGIAICTALVPSLFYVVAAPRIGPIKTAIAGSFELPVMFLIGWQVFGEPITLREGTAAALVVCAIVLVSLSRTAKPRAHAI